MTDSERLNGAWGACINTTAREPRRNDGLPEGCPTWAKPYDRMNWHRRGLVVWDDAQQRLEVVSASDAVKLLEYLLSTDTWRVEGIVITRHVSYPKPSESPPPPAKPQKRTQGRKPAGSKSSEPSQAPAPEKREWIMVAEERIRLRSQAALDFFALLQANEALLRKIADEDERQKQEALSRVYALLLRSSCIRDAQEFDPSNRPLPWTYEANAVTWTYEQPPNRATVSLTEGNWYWQGCFEQPDRFKQRSPRFTELVEALEWAENQLITIQHAVEEVTRVEAEEPPELRLSAETITDEERARLKPYWLDPAAFEPERTTFRVFIELDYAPHTFKAGELSFGKQGRYDEYYALPAVVARELQIDPIQLIIEQPLGPNDGWNRIHSRVTYYQEGIAAAQAQLVWDHSRIVQQHHAGKVERARYGFQEVETGYCTWLGACEDPKLPWPIPRSRMEYLSDKALRATLIHALDIDGFRRFTGISKDDLGDDDLIERLHKQRAKLAQIPEAARAESARWLWEHLARASKPIRIV